MGSFVIANIIDQHQNGDRFSMWPLHVTIVPPFEAPGTQEIVDALEPITATTQPVEVHLGNYAQFGVNSVVRLIMPNTELQALHGSIMKTVEELDWNVSSEYVKDYYSPHVTRKAGREFIGNSFSISSLAIVQALGQGYRRIVSELPLGVQ